ncbi:MAG: 2-C-methyl-D-erythritol 2,4-cyclodiphosphate synthase [Spirochaetaceae bacterium]|jgi:2-C-methyl-D-erythritol 2,4-cyclodiphosphate synthase/2-C-methyl-D-erythritol 4-phosphate cytidylyltransferase/2-C-methyl-D-erythritol 2,4-cyclodiphosphate synthase|nr:2-C-methyl-D-erythritol 2,4-cyclodiphosphate synthase [Spirochaetaceae bacterium]
MNLRIGLGHDLHPLAEGRPFLLAGIRLPFEKGEQGHSDGDVLAHAAADALLGAAALGDIGELFSPQDPAWKNADSMKLLRQVWSRVRSAGWRLVNMDCVVICENPKILPFREQIRTALASALEAETGAVFVKGKTAESLGPAGKGLAVEANAVCLLKKI